MPLFTEPSFRFQPVIEFSTCRPSLLLPKAVSEVMDARGIKQGKALSARWIQSSPCYQDARIRRNPRLRVYDDQDLPHLISLLSDDKIEGCR